MCQAPDVTTARLYGRRPLGSDVVDYVRFWTDERVPEEAWPRTLRSADDARRVLQDTIADWDRCGFGPWTVVERDTNTIVGRVGLAQTGVAGRTEVEVDWFVSGDVWGRGYATEMADEAIRVAFDWLDLSEVVALTTPVNAASQAVMRKLGFRYETNVEHGGLPHVLFRLAAVDWRHHRQRQ